MTTEDVVRALIADPDNGITEPEFNLRGSVACWVKVRNGVVVELEFDRSFDLNPFPGIAFARESETSEDGPDLTVEQAEAVAEGIEEWKLSKVEDMDGNTYFDADGFDVN